MVLTASILVDDLEELTKEQLNDKSAAYFDGVVLIDNSKDLADDISNVYSITKDHKRVNLQDFYEENGAYEVESRNQFLEAIKNLMDREDYYRNKQQV